ncbi:uncharacterized protein N7515_002492 [Penicillium bovifimosum]|uniref:F-box domain-containing protein n=1 Tax=Penicillium bovifimosum TaxID=126998 RepID=A0A9W9HBM5_9EURO|nr:uncharacterized protein N7515_002492 [Penicillium bovifimosum]KAJ5143705.1 hypothetical protein N7515_002492 [Penicillium bovifimosum]
MRPFSFRRRVRHALARFRPKLPKVRLPKNRKNKTSGHSAISGIQKIPHEIFQLIIAFLPIPAQICFALTCKSLLAAFQCFLDGENLSLPQLLPRGDRLALVPNVDECPRVQLLHQLENDRWKYCADCWDLHPLAAFCVPRGRASLAISSSLLSADTLRPICMPYAGEVSICPCRRITFRDKQYLMEQPNFNEMSDSQLSRILYYRQFLYPLTHKCAVTGHPKYVIEVETALRESTHTHTLCVLSRHRVYLRSETTQRPIFSSTWDDTSNTPSGGVPRLPGKTAREFLKSLYEESGSGFVGWNNSRKCRLEFNKHGRGVSVYVVRSLGKEDWPDRDWARQCR